MMTEEIKVSVVVPCYNVEKFVRQCLESLKCQTLRDMEFIVVNDGSTDGTFSIIEDIERGDRRFVVINKQNTGYGDSVNQGLDKARGEYVGIIESDDWCEPNMFEVLYSNAKKMDLDISRGSFWVFENGEDNVSRSPKIPKETLCRPLEQQSIFLQPPAIWASIYKTKWLKESAIFLQQTAGASFQDISFAFKTNLMCRRYWATSRCLMHYRIHGNNSVKKSHAPFVVLDEYAECIRWAKDKGLFSCIKSVIPTIEYQTYKWNYLRLPEKEANEFFQKWRQEWIMTNRCGIAAKNFLGKIRLYRFFIIYLQNIFKKYYLDNKRK